MLFRKGMLRLEQLGMKIRLHLVMFVKCEGIIKGDVKMKAYKK